MSKNKIIKLTNSISLISIVLLLYWVFVFISIQVFGFKVFRENITESFYLSIFGILSLLFGAVIVNVMFNLTKISEVMSGEYNKNVSRSITSNRSFILAFIFSFPLIFVLLYYGDFRSAKAKENYLVESARYIVDNNQESMNSFSSFNMDSTYFSKVKSELTILSKEFEKFPSISLIHKVVYEGKTIFIRLTNNSYWSSKSDITNYIYPCSPDEKEYLQDVFSEQKYDFKFSSADGNYELYYPVKNNDKLFVLYFTDYQRYGKIGS